MKIFVRSSGWYSVTSNASACESRPLLVKYDGYNDRMVLYAKKLLFSNKVNCRNGDAFMYGLLHNIVRSFLGKIFCINFVLL